MGPKRISGAAATGHTGIAGGRAPGHPGRFNGGQSGSLSRANAGLSREACDPRPEAHAGRSGANRPQAHRCPARESRPMISEFFIERPIFANVIAIVTILLGWASLLSTCRWRSTRKSCRRQSRLRPITPAAAPTSFANTVGIPIEQAVNGVEGSIYMPVDQRQRRQLHPDGLLQCRHRSEHFPVAGAKRRQRCHGAASARVSSESQGVTVKKVRQISSCWSASFPKMIATSEKFFQLRSH